MTKPIRKIVTTRGHEFLNEAWTKKSFATAGTQIEQNMKSKGMNLNEKFHPVPLAFATTSHKMGNVNPVETYKTATPSRKAEFCLEMEFEDQEAVDRFTRDKFHEEVAIFANPTIHAFPSYCGNPAVGTHYDVIQKAGIHALRAKQLTGKNVRVAIVDTGIDGTQISVKGGWSPDSNYQPGTYRPDHGTMCAFDVRIAAPEADIYDFALLQSSAGFGDFLLSDAIMAFDELRRLLLSQPGPLVVNNSWGLFDRSDDDPIGTSGNYSANPMHPFNQIVADLVETGADVFFAAGNCGGNCPDGRCGSGDTGPGSSIHGANSHPDVTTVAAVTVGDVRLGYSSQGPGGLSKAKPDIAAYSHFRGSLVYPADGGTSAACPVAAGIAAATRQAFGLSSLDPGQLKGVLSRTARDLGGTGWDYDHGFGVIDAAAALRHLMGS